MTDGLFPLLIDNGKDVSDIGALQTWIKAYRNELKAQLAEAGAIVFRGFPIQTPEHFDTFAEAFGYSPFTYADSLSNAVRVNLTPRVFTANEAPPDIEIYLHHEMAQTPVSPEKLFFCCLRPADQGGETPLCRSDRLWSEFKAKHPRWAQQFRALGVKYRMQMPNEDNPASGQGRSWRSTLSVQTRRDAEQKLGLLGYRWQWQQDDGIATETPVLPAVKLLPDGTESFYNQVIAANLGWQRASGSAPPPVTFGDESAIPEAAINALVESATSLTKPMVWQSGDVALIDNHRVMHGRYPYSGDRIRKVIVSLAKES